MCVGRGRAVWAQGGGGGAWRGEGKQGRREAGWGGGAQQGPARMLGVKDTLIEAVSWCVVVVDEVERDRVGVRGLGLTLAPESPLSMYRQRTWGTHHSTRTPAVMKLQPVASAFREQLGGRQQSGAAGWRWLCTVGGWGTKMVCHQDGLPPRWFATKMVCHQDGLPPTVQKSQTTGGDSRATLQAVNRAKGNPWQIPHAKLLTGGVRWAQEGPRHTGRYEGKRDKSRNHFIGRKCSLQSEVQKWWQACSWPDRRPARLGIVTDHHPK